MEDKFYKYETLSNESLVELYKEIEELKKYGWQPIGRLEKEKVADKFNVNHYLCKIIYKHKIRKQLGDEFSNEIKKMQEMGEWLDVNFDRMGL